MQHPLLTALFDLFLIGTAVCVIAALVAEHIASREPAVGGARRRSAAPALPVSGRWSARPTYSARTSRRAA